MATASASANIGNILLQNEVLLESGTNELEMLVFHVADYTFGINVAKVREVLPATVITSLPKAHPSVRGVFKLRNQVVPCVSLIEHLGISPTIAEPESTMILTDINQQQTAFLVDDVERIHRLSWEQILSVPGLLAMSQAPMTGVARLEGGRMIVMLDFENVLAQVTGADTSQDAVENTLDVPRGEIRLLLADDSPTVREAIGMMLRNSGYTNVTFFENGSDAWKCLEGAVAGDGRAEDVADLLISDVEMPHVDGFHLTKRIKEHPKLKHLPVMLYSSIVTPDNHKKGAAVGADMQVSKPELAKVVSMADELIVAARSRSEGVPHVATEATPASSSATKSEPAALSAPPSSSPKPASPAPTKPSVTSAAPHPAKESKAATPPVTSPAPAATKTETVVDAKPAAAVTTNEVDSPRNAPASEAPPAYGTQVSTLHPQLWATFRDELQSRSERLSALIEGDDGDEPDSEAINELLRTLHSIKSAAMVVPVEEISGTTHLIESLVGAAVSGSGDWPLALLRQYTQWLESVTNAPDDVDQILAKATDLHTELAERIAQIA